MKAIFFFSFYALALNAMANSNVGFICKKQNIEIAREMIDEQMTLVITDTSTRAKQHNSKIVLPMDGSLEAYQERVGTYFSLLNDSQLRFPFMPAPLMAYHLNKSTQLYKKGFDAMEGKNPASELSKMYCKAMIESILAF